MPHFCMDEAWAIMFALPWIGFAFRWARAYVTARINSWRGR